MLTFVKEISPDQKEIYDEELESNEIAIRSKKTWSSAAGY